MTSGISPALAQSLVASLRVDCGVAAKAASLLQARPGHVLEEGEFRIAGVAAPETGALRRVLQDFQQRGWCRRDGGGWNSRPDSMPASVPAFLEGAAAMWRHRGPPIQAEAVVTMPAGGSHLAKTLPTLGLAHVGLAQTRETFSRIARQARSSLIIASPFLNDDGLSWALGLFAETEAPLRRLVVRGRGDTRTVLVARAAEVSALGVKIFDYAIPPPDGQGYESFHAKIVIADESVAYVGSANMLVHERSPVELGVLLEGGPVPQLAAVMRAIQQISWPFP